MEGIERRLSRISWQSTALYDALRVLSEKAAQLGKRYADLAVPGRGMEILRWYCQIVVPHLALRCRRQIFPSCWITRRGKKIRCR